MTVRRKCNLTFGKKDMKYFDRLKDEEPELTQMIENLAAGIVDLHERVEKLERNSKWVGY